MQLRWLITILTFLISLCVNLAYASDPYKAIEAYTLENGLKVYLAPSTTAQLTTVKLVVNVGWQNESPAEIGVSHLLEHVLFRNSRLKNNMSYLQLIQENGGEANGTTTQYYTNYFASVPKKKTMWLIDSFREMIFAPSIIDEYTKNEKKTVLLEIGQPGIVADFFGVDLLKYLFPKYLRQKTFYESEFGVHFENNFSREEERLNTKKLKTVTLQKHYDTYYSPSNMILYIAGGFDIATVKKSLKQQWSKVVAFNTPAPLPPQVHQLKRSPYYQLRSSNENFGIALGTKFTDITLEEEVALRVYLSHLEHRLMKTWRNEKGLIYSVQSDINVRSNYGHGGIEFSTEKETYSQLYEEAKEILRSEALKGTIDDSSFSEAKELYLKNFDLSTLSAANMLFYAENIESILKDYGSKKSPYEVVVNMSLDDYKLTLQKHFKENLWYHYLNFPPFLFKFEDLFFEILIFLTSFVFIRKRLTKPFLHSKIKLVRKVAYPPLFLLEAFTLILCFYTYMHFTLLTNQFISSVSTTLHLPYLGYYTTVVVSIIIAAIIIPILYGLLPYKIMVNGSDLIFKSRSLLSRRYPLTDIERIEVAPSFLSILFNPKLFWKLKWRQFYFHPQFWKPIMVIHFKQQTAIAIQMKDSHGCKNDLEDHILKV